MTVTPEEDEEYYRKLLSPIIEKGILGGQTMSRIYSEAGYMDMQSKLNEAARLLMEKSVALSEAVEALKKCRELAGALCTGDTMNALIVTEMVTVCDSVLAKY